MYQRHLGDLLLQLDNEVAVVGLTFPLIDVLVQFLWDQVEVEGQTRR